jgi:glycerophosphoryl diester phosphodiesterase
MHEKYPGMKLAMLVEELNGKTFEDVLKDLKFTPDIYSPHYSLVHQSVVRQCHEKGIKIIPWTVNDKEKIQKLKELGVDGIITDYPDLFN